ncbi:VUT family protein [bacterium]|nr:VUT family protein [bacterium]
MNRERGRLLSFIREKFKMMAILLRSIPTIIVVLFVITLVSMNFLAQFTIVNLPWLALNAGISISWLSFLSLDIVSKHFGLRASNILSVIAMFLNLLFALIFLLVSKILNIEELDLILGGQWSILLASSLAFLLSALTNNYANVFIGKKIKSNPDSAKAFMIRSYISTLLGQIIDNFMFVFLAFMVFSYIPGATPVHYTLLQCIGCSIACAFIELFIEIIFSPIGYKVSKKFKENNVGQEYNDLYNKE